MTVERTVVLVLNVEGTAEVLVLEEAGLLVAGEPDEVPQLATFGPGMAYALPPLSGLPVLP